MSKEELEKTKADSWYRLVEHYKDKPIRQSAVIITKGDKVKPANGRYRMSTGGIAISYNELTSDRFSALPQLNIEEALREAGVTLIFVDPTGELTKEAQCKFRQLLDMLCSFPVFYLKRIPFDETKSDWRVINKTESLDAAMNEAIDNMQMYMTNAPR